MKILQSLSAFLAFIDVLEIFYNLENFVAMKIKKKLKWVLGFWCLME